MIVNIIELYGLLALLLAVGVAFWRGGALERRVAMVIAAAWIGSLIVDNDGSRGVQWAIFAIDIALAIYLMGETLFGRKVWPAFAAAAQILIILTHTAFAVDENLIQEAFFSAYYVWSYVVLTCLFLGSLLASHAGQARLKQRRAAWRRPGRPAGSG